MSTGWDHGAGPGLQITSHGVKFVCLSDPSKGPRVGTVWHPDLSQISEHDLKKALERAAAKTQRKEEQT